MTAAMMRALRHLPLLALVGGASLILGAEPARAADDYTYPFYDPAVTMSYGVDRDSRVGVQLDYTGKTWWDSEPHPGRVYDNHTGLDYPMSLLNDIAASKKGVVVDIEGGYDTEEFGAFGNFVQVRHADDRHTLYYHLASSADGGITVDVDDEVAAGQRVGLSGCSGYCFGPHLHFEVLVESGNDLVTTDPMFRRLWTTWPGRVPFRAAYHDESNSGTEVVRRSRTITHWVEFRNTGGRTWRRAAWPGRVVLGTWDPAQHASPFQATDWSSTWLATRVDQSTVAPDAIGRFTFGIRGGPPPGSYRETFNLLSQAVRWFDHDQLGGFFVPIIVSNLTE